MTTLTVKPGQSITAAVDAAPAGATIDVYAGTYTDNFLVLSQSVTLQAVNAAGEPVDTPVVHLVETQAPPNDKGMITVGTTATPAGSSFAINGFEISGVAIPARDGGNGAAIRYQSGDLTLNGDWLHNNQDGLLATPLVQDTGTITINQSQVGFNGIAGGHTHNIYVGMVNSLTITNSYIHDADVGTEIQSRAESNSIEDNRIFDNNSSASYSISLPNGGVDIVQGDTIEKGSNSQNKTTMIAFMQAPGTETPPNFSNDHGHWANSSLTVNDNTFVNDNASSVPAVWNASTTPVSVTLMDNSFWNVNPAKEVLGSATVSGSINLTTRPTLVCFTAGTHISTPDGERIVESLAPGDIVLTLADGRLSPRPVKWIGRRRIDLTAHPTPDVVAPVRIQCGAFADNVPHSDLLLSLDHAIFVDGKLICARQLINGTTIRQEKDLRSIEYFHVELDAHAILLAEGLPAESYLNTGNRSFFANSDKPLVLHPDLTDEPDYPTRQAGSCAPFVWDEPSVRPVWQRLADRAAAIGQPVPQPTTTTEANLRVRGRRGERNHGKPLYADSNLVLFVLPRGEKEFRLISRAQSPTEARPWVEDRRKLGVRVKRIVLRGADELHEIPLDHPGLTMGWWAVERDGQVMSRWTNGDAILPLPLRVSGEVILEIHLADAMTYVVEVEAPETRRAAA